MVIKAVEEKIWTVIAGAFAFVAALFWNDAIKAWIDTFVTTGDSVLYKFYAALIVTIIAAVVLYIISKLSTRK